MTGGGTDTNEWLTAATGLVLFVLLAVLGPTIVLIGQLISVHLFVGLLLIGPVLMKLATTGYRFVRYYTGDPEYRRKGPPPLSMRALAPLLVIATIVVFVSGCLLLIDGPGSKGSWLELHKVSFIVWVVVASLHVLGHLIGLPASLRLGAAGRRPLLGRRGRRFALVVPVIAGLVLAIALIPQYSAWTAHGALKGHHHESG